MEPLFHMRARRRLGRAWLPAFGQDEQGQQEIGSAKRCRSPSWTHISEILQALAADERSKNKTETEGHADKPHFFRPFFRWRDISDVSLRHGYIPPAEPRRTSATAPSAKERLHGSPCQSSGRTKHKSLLRPQC